MGKLKDSLLKLLGEDKESQEVKTFKEQEEAAEVIKTAAKLEKKAKKKAKKEKKAAEAEPSEMELKITAALEKQKIEMEAVYNEKLKNVKSNSLPPQVGAPVVPAVQEGVDFKKWNEKVNGIRKRIANQT